MTPPNTFSFVLDMIGTETGKTYEGRFTYKRPTVGERRDIDQIEHIFNTEYQKKYSVKDLSSKVKNYNYTISYLKVCLKECPEWFTGSDYGLGLEDENIVDFIAFKIKSFEDERVKTLEEIFSQPRVKTSE